MFDGNADEIVTDFVIYECMTMLLKSITYMTRHRWLFHANVLNNNHTNWVHLIDTYIHTPTHTCALLINEVFKDKVKVFVANHKWIFLADYDLPLNQDDWIGSKAFFFNIPIQSDLHLLDTRLFRIFLNSLKIKNIKFR